jgi:hypothetical protein
MKSERRRYKEIKYMRKRERETQTQVRIEGVERQDVKEV